VVCGVLCLGGGGVCVLRVLVGCNVVILAMHLYSHTRISSHQYRGYGHECIGLYILAGRRRCSEPGRL
jgi:hypothetical protein